MSFDFGVSNDNLELENADLRTDNNTKGLHNTREWEDFPFEEENNSSDINY
jgi:hypothetical protein